MFVFRFGPSLVFAAFALALAIVSYPHAPYPDSVSARATEPYAMHRLSATPVADAITDDGSASDAQSASQSDLRLMATLIARALQSRAPYGCATVGGWEDGTLIAACPDTDSWVAIGPDPDDAWEPYAGDVSPRWQRRAACLDGQLPTDACQSDPFMLAVYGIG